MDDMPPGRRTEFVKYFRARDYGMNWVTQKGNFAHVFLGSCLGCPFLSIEVRDGDGHTVSRTVHKLDLEELRERGMVEEVDP